MQYVGGNIAEGVAENWVDAEMSLVEVGGGGWSWVHGLVIPEKYYIIEHFLNYGELPYEKISKELFTLIGLKN